MSYRHKAAQFKRGKMKKDTLERKSAQEKQLDHIEKLLRTLTHQVETKITDYREQDVRALREAVTAINKVTLLSDSELDNLQNAIK
jgi:hypothetical protein